MNSLADLIAGAVIALLSGMGVGSAGLLVVWLTLTSSVPQATAQALNLYFFMFSSAASLPVHLRRRKIFWTAAGLMIVTGAVGAVAGSALSAHVDPTVLRRLFGGMLVFCGSASLLSALSPFLRKMKLKKRKNNG